MKEAVSLCILCVAFGLLVASFVYGMWTGYSDADWGEIPAAGRFWVLLSVGIAYASLTVAASQLLSSIPAAVLASVFLVLQACFFPVLRMHKDYVAIPLWLSALPLTALLMLAFCKRSPLPATFVIYPLLHVVIVDGCLYNHGVPF